MNNETSYLATPKFLSNKKTKVLDFVIQGLRLDCEDDVF